MSYGPVLPEDGADDEARGLIFTCFNASIVRQFETVNRWLRSGKPFGLDHGDLLTDSTGEPAMTIEGDPPVRLRPQPGRPLVTTRARGVPVPAGQGSARRARRGGRPAMTPLGKARHFVKFELRPGILRMMLRSHRFMRLTRRLPFHLRCGGRLWITRYDEVDAVLQRQHEFGMTYQARMEQLEAPFILGLNPSHEYRAERDALVEALASVDLATLETDARSHARELLDGYPGEVDLIGELTDGVLARTVGPALWNGDALTPDDVARARAVARDIFINPFADPAVRHRGEVEAPRLRERARELIADQAVTATPGALGVLRTELPTDEPIDDLLGLMVAWVTSVSRTMGFAFDVLLGEDMAPQLEQAQRAARNGDLDRVGRILLEALRFKPSMPALDRVCTRETQLRGHRIRRGQPLWVVLTSAMMDERKYPSPQQFREDRPACEYLHFGHPRRRCLGEQIAQRQMVAISAELLRHSKVRRVSKMSLDGPYPKSLKVAFGAIPS